MATVDTPVEPTTTDQIEIALVGNPNTGKSTLFNRLTGVRQRVGNYPGVTVEKKVGTATVNGESMTLIDLPGAYSLAAASLDERVVFDVLTGHMEGTKKPEVVVCVTDASNLMRNLFLASQISELGLPMVIALNMWDQAQEQNIAIDAQLLSDRLGVPVVPTVAAKGRGVEELRDAIAHALEDETKMVGVDWPDAVKEATRCLRESTGEKYTEAELHRFLFDIDSCVKLPTEHCATCENARRCLSNNDLDPVSAEAVIRYGWLAELLEGVVTHPTVRKATATESVDKLLTHRVAGLVIFVGMMWVVFQAIYSWSGPMMDGIDYVSGSLGDIAGGWLEGSPMLQSLVVDGVIAGVGGVVIFLPQILVLFLFIAILEDSGYMARAAFLMDKLFAWCGLNGKSFVPMLSSYACAIPGVMGARTIEDPKARLTTILIAPLMSCSARLPVYVLLIGAFIEPQYGATVAGLVLLAMHFVGLAVAIPVALVLKLVLKTKPSPFVLEMPPYRVPQLRDVVWRMWDRGKEFLIRAGTVIFAFTIIIWALMYFPRPAAVEQRVTEQFAQQQNVTVEQLPALIEADEALGDSLSYAVDSAYIEQSIMGRAGKAVQPVFAPAGFDWKITVGVLGSFPAREVIIATLGITYSLGGDVDEESADLVGAMAASTHADGSKVYTVPVALAIMVFFALCMQCGATLATMARELNWGWASFGFVYMTLLAWVGAVATYQLGTWIASA